MATTTVTNRPSQKNGNAGEQPRAWRMAVGLGLALLVLLALPAVAQPPSNIACDTDVSDLIAGVTGAVGNGGNPDSLFFIDAATGQTTLIAGTAVTPNHLAYDSDRQLMYYVDHGGQALYAYDINTATTTLIDADIRTIAGTGDMPAGFVGHDAGTYWNGRYYVIPVDGASGNTGDDLHWMEFDATGLVIVDSGLVPLSLPGGITEMGDFGDIVIDQAGILFGSTTSQAAGQLDGLFRADLNLALPVVTVINAAYTGAQLALSGDDELYGNDWTTGEIVELNKVTGAINSTAAVDFGGDFYDLAPVSPNDCDWGDLADPPYDTAVASGGPAHKVGVVTNVFLGSLVDDETDGQPSADASGDGADEDGVAFLNPFFPGGATDIDVDASGAGFLNAWIDFNSDGDFTDAGEQIASDLAVVAGSNILNNVPVPAGATGVSAARFRVTVATGEGGDSPSGSADNGEVEDYVLACLGGTVWNDLDGDGIQDGGSEVGVANVTVTLVIPVSPFTPIVDGNGAPVTTTTDSNGDYQFCGLPTVDNSGLANPGEYRVLFDRPAPFVDFSPPNQGGDDTLDSDADQDINGLGVEGLAPIELDSPVTLNANDTDLTIDAGLRAVTAALVTSAGTYLDNGSVVFEFSTGYEALSTSFDVYRYDDEAGDYRRITESAVSALLGSPQGGTYRVVDPSAASDRVLTYVVVEHQADAKTQTYGPFRTRVDVDGRRKSLDAAAEARPHRSRRLRQRLARRPAQRKTEASFAAGSSGFADPGVTRHTALLNARESGLHFVAAADLAAQLGLPEVDVREALLRDNLAIENRGRPIAWFDASGVGDGAYFVAEAIDSLYTLDNVYWLRVNAPAVPMEWQPGTQPVPAPGGTFSSTERFEQDLLPSINATLTTETDYWYWDGINAASAERIRTFDLAVPDIAAGSATLRARFAGGTNGPAAEDHYVVLRVNGAEVGSLSWGGMQAAEGVFTFDAALLTSLSTVEVEASLVGGSAASIIFIDGFELDYPRSYRAAGDSLLLTGQGNSVVTVDGFSTADVVVLDLSDPALPSRLADVWVDDDGEGGYRASFVPGKGDTPYLAATLSTARNGTDLRPHAPEIELTAGHHRFEHVVIAPEAWRAEAESLAAFHEGQGLASVAVSLEQVYADFSHGVATPWAIRDFLRYAKANWRQGPDFAVLAGRGTFDPRDLQGGGDSFVPTVLVGTPNGLIPSDNLLADLEGGDSVPDIALGRLPIVSAEELATYVGKLGAYEDSDGDWRQRALMAADNEDPAGNFPTQSLAAAGLLGSYQIQHVDLGVLTTAETRDALIAEWNAGVQLVNYVGHGGVTQAAAEGLLRTIDMDALVNGDRLPIVSALTCVLGRSDIPLLESLAEALVTDEDGGAIAVWGPTGVSLSGAAHELNILYVGLLEAAPENSRLGSIVLQVMTAFAQGGGTAAMLDTYGIVGDPAVRLP